MSFPEESETAIIVSLSETCRDIAAKALHILELLIRIFLALIRRTYRALRKVKKQDHRAWVMVCDNDFFKKMLDSKKLLVSYLTTFVFMFLVERYHSNVYKFLTITSVLAIVAYKAYCSNLRPSESLNYASNWLVRNHEYFCNFLIKKWLLKKIVNLLFDVIHYKNPNHRTKISWSNIFSSLLILVKLVISIGNEVKKYMTTWESCKSLKRAVFSKIQSSAFVKLPGAARPCRGPVWYNSRWSRPRRRSSWSSFSSRILVTPTGRPRTIRTSKRDSTWPGALDTRASKAPDCRIPAFTVAKASVSIPCVSG